MLSSARWFNHTNIYLFGLILLVVGLPLSNFLVSISQFILLGNWLLELNYRVKLQKFWENKLAVTFVGLFFMHLISLSWSNDLKYGLHDLKIKLPILILPFVLSSISGISKKHIKTVLLLFTIATTVATFICFKVYQNKLARNELFDMRSISIFTSHIRFGLMIVLSIIVLVYYTFIEGVKKPIWQQIGVIILIRWLLYFMGLLQSLTANFILGFLVVIISFNYLFDKKVNVKSRTIVIIFLLASLIGSGIYFYHIGYRFIKKNKFTLKELTVNGNKYTHYLERKQVENGNRVWVNVCEEELGEKWNSDWRHSIEYSGKDALGQPLKSTIIRYLTSRGFSKDSLGLSKIKKSHYKSIEAGYTNVKYRKPSNSKRIYELFWSLDNYFEGGNPSGNTMAQKLEYWKTGFEIFKDNWLIGIGSGDVKNEFAKYYDQMNSKLTKESRLRAHNQYLTFGISFGVIGLVYFLILLIFTIKINHKNILAMSTIWIIVLSMLTEDTLETQAGVSFSMIFISIYFLLKPDLKNTV